MTLSWATGWWVRVLGHYKKSQAINVYEIKQPGPQQKNIFARIVCKSCQKLFESIRHVAIDIAQDGQGALLVETHRAQRLHLFGILVGCSRSTSRTIILLARLNSPTIIPPVCPTFRPDFEWKVGALVILDNGPNIPCKAARARNVGKIVRS